MSIKILQFTKKLYKIGILVYFGVCMALKLYLKKNNVIARSVATWQSIYSEEKNSDLHRNDRILTKTLCP